jgi:sugar lactone lactonase YvrE
VTETCTNLSTGAVSNYVFVGRVLTMSNSIIRFVQNRRVPQTWWGTDFDTQVYPNLNDSLMGLGTTPRGRILSQDSIRMSYLFGSTVIYDVRQIWQKFANPADTATVTFSYPNFPGMITTVAGNNFSGSGSGTSGDGGPATAAALLQVSDVVCDNAGNFYFTDGANTNYSIRKVDANGIVTRFAGNNTAGFSGDGGPATAAQLNYPQALAIDNSGNMLIADAVNRVIRRVDAAGIISTIAGIPGSFGYSGDGGPATAAQLASPAGMCVDLAGNIYFADVGRHVVRKIDVNGIITTVAGTAGTSGTFSGDGGPATAARLNGPFDVCLDPAGNLYIADKGNHAIRMVDPSGIITTVAGLGGFLNSGSTGDGGLATLAKLNSPQSVCLDPIGNLYISDNSNNKIRMVNSAGIITSVVGSGQAALLGDGPDFYAGDYGYATAASIGDPRGIFWINNKLYIATPYRIRRVVF